MLLIVVKERGRVDSLRFVRLLMMCQVVCIPKFEILFSFFHFRFGVFCLMIMVLAARTFGSR